MIPFDDIEIGDIFSNPIHRGFGELSGLLFVVVEKNEKQKMIKIQPHKFRDGIPFSHAMWKSYPDRMFSLNWKN